MEPIYATASEWGLTGKKRPTWHKPFKAHHKVDESEGEDFYFKHVFCKPEGNNQIATHAQVAELVYAPR